MVRRAEGAEKEFTKDDYLPAIRGGQSIEYFFGYPHVSGSWIPKLEVK